MRKVTEKAALAFKEGKPFKSGSTEIFIDILGGVGMYLYGRQIAFRNPNGSFFRIKDDDHRTATTKERLNGLLETLQVKLTIHSTEANNSEWLVRDKHGNNTYWPGSLTMSLREQQLEDK